MPMEDRAHLPYPTYPLENLVPLFMSSLLQPDTPCSKLFLGSLVAMTHPDGAIDNIRRRAPEVLSALMHILTRDEEPREILDDLVEGWYHDHCDCHRNAKPLVVEVRDFAERLVGPDVSFLPFLFIYFITSPLAVALLPIETQHSHRTTRSVWNKLGSERWPRAPSELSPHGIDRTIERLLEWPLGLTIAGRHHNHNPIDVATITSKPLLLLAIIEEVNPLLSGTIRHHNFPRTITSMVQLLLAQETVNVPLIRQRVQTALDNCVDLIRTIRLLCCARDSDLQAFVQCASSINILDIFLMAMSDLLGAISRWTHMLGFHGDLEAIDSPCREVTRGFSLAVAAVLRQLGRTPDAAHYHPVIVRIYHNTFSRTNGNPFYLVTSPLGRLYQEDACCRRGCNASGATEPRPLALCSSCGVARYCSKFCQRVAWRDHESPHKGACRDLAAFKQLVYPTGSYQLGFGAWLHFDDVHATELQKTLAWRVFNHLAHTLDHTVIHTDTFDRSVSSPEDASTQQDSNA